MIDEVNVPANSPKDLLRSLNIYYDSCCIGKNQIESSQQIQDIIICIVINVWA